jgi:S1-C subfamily serine protease
MLTQGLFAPNPNGGFQVENVKLGSVYARMGLRVGDVLRGVNGRPVDSTEQLMVRHQQLNEGGHGEVEVLREGQPQTLHFGGS